jgi:predicted nucleic acid-binding protein
MATLLLDSTVIFDALNFKRGRREYLTQLLQQGHILASCPINFIEVYAGLRDHEQAHTEQFLGSLKFHPITAQVAKKAGFSDGSGNAKGRLSPRLDVILAAVALHYHLGFLTDNRKHFPMPELNLHQLP